MPLALAPLNAEVSIRKIIADDKTKRHLESLGFVVGSRVTPLSGAGDLIIKVLDSRLAISRALALKIIVSPS